MGNERRVIQIGTTEQQDTKEEVYLDSKTNVVLSTERGLQERNMSWYLENRGRDLTYLRLTYIKNQEQ